MSIARITPVLVAYDKAIKVIDSCENQFHLDASRNYINGFFKSFASQNGDKLSVDEFTANRYLSLKRTLLDKKKLLNL